MPQAELLLQLFVVALDAPAQFGDGHQFAQADGHRQIRQPAFRWLPFCLRPLDQQPCSGCGSLRQSRFRLARKPKLRMRTKPRGKRWEQETAQELFNIQGHEPLLVAVGGIAPAEGDVDLRGSRPACCWRWRRDGCRRQDGGAHV